MLAPHVRQDVASSRRAASDRPSHQIFSGYINHAHRRNNHGRAEWWAERTSRFGCDSSNQAILSFEIVTPFQMNQYCSLPPARPLAPHTTMDATSWLTLEPRQVYAGLHQDRSCPHPVQHAQPRGSEKTRHEPERVLRKTALCFKQAVVLRVLVCTVCVWLRLRLPATNVHWTRCPVTSIGLTDWLRPGVGALIDVGDANASLDSAKNFGVEIKLILQTHVISSG